MLCILSRVDTNLTLLVDIVVRRVRCAQCLQMRLLNHWNGREHALFVQSLGKSSVGTGKKHTGTWTVVVRVTIMVTRGGGHARQVY